jgi:CheY-like chemotaxis protein
MPPIILIVDDNSGLRHALGDVLSDTGYVVEQAADGIVALRRIARRAPDLILTDVRMPYLDGIGLATILTPHTPSIPIILMSADPLPCDCVLPYIRKPFEVEALLTLMARTLPMSAVVTVALNSLGAA